MKSSRVSPFVTSTTSSLFAASTMPKRSPCLVALETNDHLFTLAPTVSAWPAVSAKIPLKDPTVDQAVPLVNLSFAQRATKTKAKHASVIKRCFCAAIKTMQSVIVKKNLLYILATN
ncbi:hypothetical protein C8J56DRAFT_1163517 [Mycena floridula]|nr:hypothetical protein C8J56DRAFT_1163517 [Mycena floridula]